MKKSILMKIGVGLILLSGVAFASMLIFPLLNLPTKTKAVGATASFIAMEVLFYAGGFLVGKELFTKYKSYLNPKNWFKSKQKIKENES